MGTEFKFEARSPEEQQIYDGLRNRFKVPHYIRSGYGDLQREWVRYSNFLIRRDKAKQDYLLGSTGTATNRKQYARYKAYDDICERYHKSISDWINDNTELEKSRRREDDK